MLRSMTGQGQAQAIGELGTVSVEIRSVNNRGFKLTARLGERLSRFESRIDSIVRQSVTRGTLNINARWQRTDLASAYSLNGSVLSAYYRNLVQLQSGLGASGPIDLAQLAHLPGVVEEADDQDVDAEHLFEFFAEVLSSALERFNSMRLSEGEAMGERLDEDLSQIESHLATVTKLAPAVVDGYRDRLESRIEHLLRERGLDVAGPDIIKEVQIFADRCDISEEITRLDSHIKMFRETASTEQPSGRRLDFVTQEMFRETNTIGSKANNADIAACVVDMKCAIERIRELVQNIE